MKDKSIYKDAPSYCHYYFDLLETDELLIELEKSQQLTQALFQQITKEKENYAYEPGKWSIKEVLRHIIDCERIFAYRALRFSRNDSTELPGFNENSYMEALKGVNQNLSDLLEEYLVVRKASILLFKSLSEAMLNYTGTANKLRYSAKMLGFMIIGHNLHHCIIIKQRYLN
jgi:uncharacterized damage-inducible protein DinB